MTAYKREDRAFETKLCALVDAKLSYVSKQVTENFSFLRFYFASSYLLALKYVDPFAKHSPCWLQKRVPVYVEPCIFGNPNCTTTHYSNGDVECSIYYSNTGDE